MPRILVVEDEIHIQRLIKLVLEKQAYTVESVGTGEDALEYLLKHEKPDLILLDIMMPGIDGLQVLRKIKGNADHRDIPVVMLTALAQENVVIQGIKLGAKDYIRKPFHPTELVKRLSKHLVAG
ncbi:MAG: response regulator [Proteobacteria bacterium]|nr:response regulator [Pseudomonadota bacterium]